MPALVHFRQTQKQASNGRRRKNESQTQNRTFLPNRPLRQPVKVRQQAGTLSESFVRVVIPSFRSLLFVAPFVHSLDVVWMIVSSCSSHSSGFDMVGDDLAALGKRVVADSAFPALLGDLPVE